MRDDWVECSFGEIFDFIGGGTPSKKENSYWNGNIPWASIKDIKGKYLNNTINTITRSGLNNSAANIAQNGEIILATRISPGKPIIAKRPTAINQDLKIIKPKGSFNLYYLYYGLLTLSRQILKVSSGTTVLGINLTNLKQIQFPLSPLPEQRAIVAKIEELFSSIDNGISDLNKASAQLKIYRQAVLKKAFTGELSKEWHAKQTNLPTASELLHQIQAERQKHHQQLLTKWQEAIQVWQDGGKEGKKPTKPRAMKEFAPLTKEELVNMPQLSDGYIRLGEYITTIDAGKSFRCEERPPFETEIGVAKVSAVTWGEYNEDESKTCFDESKINRSYFIKTGDFIFSRANTIELVGACVIVNKTKLTIMLSDKTLRLNFTGGLKTFFMHYLRCKTGRLEIKKRSTGNQDSMRNIGQDRIKSIVVPLFSKEEQLQIVQEIESRLSVCDNIEQTISASLAKAEALRQSILKKAFAGELLSATALTHCRQEPDWQPASELLKQIKAEKNDK